MIRTRDVICFVLAFQLATTISVARAQSLELPEQITAGKISAANATQDGDADSGLSWVWDQENAKVESDNENRFFRVTFKISGAPKSAKLQITADNTYTAYINGELIGSNDDWKDVESYTAKVTDNNKNVFSIKNGKNVLAMQVKNTGGPAGVIALLRVTTKDDLEHSFRTNIETRVAKNVRGIDWTKHGFDDSKWDKVAVLGGPEIGPWFIVKPDPNAAKNKIIRDLANDLIYKIENDVDYVAGNSIIQLAHLAVDNADVNILEPPTETLNPADEAEHKLMEKTIEVVSRFVFDPSDFKRCAAWNAIKFLILQSATAQDATLTKTLLSAYKTSFRSIDPHSPVFQLIILSSIEDVVKTFKSAFDANKQKIADKAAEIQSKEAEIAKINAEIDAKKKEKEELANLKEEIDRRFVVATAAVPQNGALVTDLTASKKTLGDRIKLIGSEITPLDVEHDKLTGELAKLKGEKEKLSGSDEKLVNRIKELLDFLSDVESSTQSTTAQAVHEQVRGTTYASMLTFAGIDSLTKASAFGNEVSKGTVELIEGVGGPTPATDLPTATSRGTKGDGPGVSNTAPYDPEYDPTLRTHSRQFNPDPGGKRKFRDISGQDESAVEQAPGATDAPGATGATGAEGATTPVDASP